MNTATAEHRERLQTIRERTAAARAVRQRARTTLDAARAAHDEDAIAVAALAVEQAGVELETAEQLERLLLSSLAGVSNGTISSSLFDDPRVIDELASMAHSEAPIGRQRLGLAMDRDQLMASYGRTSIYAAAGDVAVPDSARTRFYGAVDQLARPLTLLDLLPKAPMDSGSFDYSPVSGNQDTAQEVVEGEIKPPADIVFGEATCKAQTVAHWFKCPKPQLADVAGLETILRNRLINGVNRRLESQALNGTGVDPNLLGLLNVPSVPRPLPVAGDTVTDRVLNGKVSVGDAGGTANAVVMNPTDVAAALKEKAQTAGTRLDSSGAFATTPSSMWGLALVETVACPVGTAIVGDWSIAVTLFVREGVQALASDNDQDDFTRNRVTLLGEGRFAIAWWQPDALAIIDLAVAPVAAEAEKAATKKA